MEPIEIVPGAQLRAAEHAGGLVAGAFEQGVMIGFVYGFLAAPTGRGMKGLGMHSHMLAVRHSGRGTGVGKALKWFQRDWCLARGIEWVCWTFDPLQAKNARLNMFHLGAVSNEYLPDFYGPMTGPLGGNQETDRLLALWQLSDPNVAEIAAEGLRSRTRNASRLPRRTSGWSARPNSSEALPRRLPNSPRRFDRRRLGRRSVSRPHLTPRAYSRTTRAPPTFGDGRCGAIFASPRRRLLGRGLLGRGLRTAQRREARNLELTESKT